MTATTTKPRRDARTRDELLREIDFHRRGGWAAQVGPTFRTGLWAFAFIGVAYFLKETLVGVAHEFAGKSTDANIVYHLLGDIRVSMWLGWAAGAGGVAMAVRERHLRKRTVERLASRNAELEAIIDPGRTSSELTRRGDTNPEDR